MAGVPVPPAVTFQDRRPVPEAPIAVSRPPVTVIVPIFNGHDALSRCLEALSAHTLGDDVSIVLADDASTDGRIAGLLEKARRADSRVTVVTRPVNLGFVANCNRAMAEAPGDVVLLNSDAFVPYGWLSRLRDLASTSERIGSITPLSNNAEIAGAPRWLTPNTFPSGVDVTVLDEAARSVGTGEWIEIPTSVGFCVYLTRAGLDAVGLFDEERFGFGYGEENDLSLRMRNAGYLNLLCDTLYVWHEGGVSFAEAGTGTLDANLRRLAERWPEYPDLIRGFISRNPLWGVQARFGLEVLRRTKQSTALRVLYLTHHPLWSGVIGGTELHAEDLIAALGERIDPVVVSFDEAGAAVVQWGRGPDATGFRIDAAAVASRPEHWVAMLLDVGIDLIHVHHAMGAPLDVFAALLAEATRLAVPVAWTLHDYFTLCPAATLLDAEDGTPCTSLGGGKVCRGCERLAVRYAGVSVETWRDEWTGHLGGASRVFAPSRAAVEVVAARLPHLQEQAVVVPHGVRPGQPVARRAEGRDVAVLGYGGAHKGDHLLVDVIEALAGRGITWHLFGRRRLAVDDRSDVIVHGPYERAGLPGLLENSRAVAVLLLSPWPETYSYTLSEAWRSGIPVIGSDLGAIGERIRSEGGGIVVDPFDSKAAAAAIDRLLADDDEMDRLASEARDIGARLPALEQVGDTYFGHYLELVTEPGPARAARPVPPDEIELTGWMGSFRSPLPL
jgi:GT2 family glycosyltransferase